MGLRKRPNLKVCAGVLAALICAAATAMAFVALGSARRAERAAFQQIAADRADQNLLRSTARHTDVLELEAFLLALATLSAAISIASWAIQRHNIRVLARTEGRYQTMIDSMPDRVIRIRRNDGRIEYCNERYAAEYGLRPSDVVGLMLADLLGNETWNEISERLFPLSRVEPRSSTETRWDRPDGSVLVESWTHCLVNGPDGTEHVFAVGHDISVRAAAQEALKASEARNQAVLANLPVAAIVTGPDGVVFANDAAAKLIGVASPTELLGQYPAKRWGLDPAVSATELRDLAEGTFGPHRRTEHFRFPSGERTVELQLSGVLFDGEPALLAVGLDVTEQIATAQALAMASELQRFLAENATNILARTDEHMRVMYANDAAQRVLGLDPDDLAGIPLHHLVVPHHRAALDALRVASIRSGSPQDDQLRFLHADPDREVWANITVQAISDNGRTEFHISISDTTEQHHAQQLLQENEEFIRSVLESLTEGVMLTDAHANVLLANTAARTFLHLHRDAPKTHDAADEHTIIDGNGKPLLPGQYPSAIVHATHQAVDEMIIGMRHDITGETAWFLANSRPLNKLGTQLALSTFVDITQHKDLEHRLATDQRLLDATLQHLDASVVAVDTTGNVTFMNRAAMKLRRFQSPDASPLDRTKRDYRYYRSDGSLVELDDEPINQALHGHEVQREIFMMRWADQTTVHLSISATAIRLANGTVTGAVAVMHDISALKRAEQELEHLARRDPLTSLPNRRHFHEALNSAVARNRRRPGAFAVLYCDLDGFKAVNDTHGHETGDELLRAVADRLRAHTRTGDVVARLGGDEFVILAEPLAKPTDAHDLARRLELALQQPFDLLAGPISVGGSFGVAIHDPQLEPDDLLSHADREMYANKTRKTHEQSGTDQMTLASTSRIT